MARAHAPPPSDPGDAERLLLAMADHLHEHCDCVRGQPACAACDLRGQLRIVREALLAWRADGRRLAVRRDEAVSNGADLLRRDGGGCDECSALDALTRTLRGTGYSATSSA